VRHKISKNNFKTAKTEVTTIQLTNKSVLVKNYDLASLFSNKLVAFVERLYYKGSDQLLPFKGRDVYDLCWFCNLSKNTSYKIKPNLPLIREKTGTNTSSFKNIVFEKLEKLDDKVLKSDLTNLVEESNVVENMLKVYRKDIKTTLDLVL
jgi:hypothetical protein